LQRGLSAYTNPNLNPSNKPDAIAYPCTVCLKTADRDTLRLLDAIDIHCNRAVYVSLNTNANPNPNPK